MPSTVKLMQNLLDYCSEKNRVIAKNISNIGTEGYQRRDVEFKDILNESSNSLLRTDNSKHISGITTSLDTAKFEYITDKNDSMDSGINNVNIEKEMSELAENTLRFKFASKKVGDYYKQLDRVIKGGGA